MRPTLDIVIPVYWEHESIGTIIAGIESAVTFPHNLLLVYDDPSDPTIAVAKKLRETIPHLRWVQNVSRGYAAAIRTGISAATADCVCFFTGDGSDRISDIAVMMEKIEQGYDLVLGSRYVPGGEKRGGSWAMNFLSRRGNRLFHLLSGSPWRDVTTSFRMMRRTVLESARFTSDVGGALYLEMAVRAARNGYRITEIPTVWIDRKAGRSKFRLLRWLPGCAYWLLWGAVQFRLHPVPAVRR